MNNASLIGREFDGFTIVREIGRGGMGTVYEAMQANPQRPVAVKILNPELAADSRAVERFSREAQRLAALEQHPNIATVYAAGDLDGIPYIVMQLMRGGDLEELLEQEGRLLPAEAVRIAALVADALDYAHRNDIIHRDIKPANIMLDGSRRPFVTDFGIAQATDEMRMTMTGMSVCTLEFASPEQLKGNPIDGRSDIYSLGLVIYRMVCGQPAFQANTPLAVAMKTLSEKPVPPSLICAGIPPALEAIILRCLAIEPAERFKDGAELAAALNQVACAPTPDIMPSVPQQTIVVQPPLPAAVREDVDKTPAATLPRSPRSVTLTIAVTGCLLCAIGLLFAGGMLGREKSSTPEIVQAKNGQLDSNTEPDTVKHQPPSPPEHVKKEPDAALLYGNNLQTFYERLGRIKQEHHQSNQPWEQYKRIHGNTSQSWNSYVMQNGHILLHNDSSLSRQYSEFADELERLTIPHNTPPSFGKLKDLMLAGARAGVKRVDYSADLIRQELDGGDPSWGKNTPYGRAKAEMVSYIGDGPYVGGRAKVHHEQAFGPELRQLRRKNEGS